MKKIMLFFILLTFIGCSNTQPNNYEKNNEKLSSNTQINQTSTPHFDFKLHLQNNSSSIIEAYDPFEKFNRKIYYLNYEFDRWIGLPVKYSYIFFLPQTARTGVTHFFTNLTEPVSAINGILILDYQATLISLGRFLINSTIGIGGLFDIASNLNLKREKRTLNEVLATYGVGRGPYLILPFLGPSDLRNASSLAVTFLLKAPIDPISHFAPEPWEKLTINGIHAINFRSRIRFRYFSLGTPFEYEYVRLLYLRASEAQILNIK